MLKTYLKRLLEVSSRGDAREESFYNALSWLFKGYADSSVDRDIHITTLPKKTEAGNPDFRIWDGKQHIVGYIEAKPPTTENLDHIANTEQLKRYRHTFPNLILTNFFEFRLYREGDLIDRVSIARPFIMHKMDMVPPVEKKGEFFKLLEKFFSFSLPKVYDAKRLAIELAKRTRFLREEVVAEELKEEEEAGKGFILGFYEAFKEYLISGLSKEDFADLYSQTITYGLFAARTRSENGFNRKLAYDKIPHTIGILRDVFEFISLGEVPKQMEWIIDDISEVLAVTDVKNILHKYFHEGKGKDPIVHFYETFLTEYDPKTREKRGVYYTPEPVVSYIVRSLHHILKEHFNRPDGFASDSVTVLDPAAGTLTFMAEAAKLAVEEFIAKYGEGGKEEFIKDHILKNFYAFELMMAPYAVGHLKMSFLLEELGYKLKEDDRFKLYLTNTLEMEELAETKLPGMASLSEESHLAGKVKKEQPILVILGNPPYSVSSVNKSDFIVREMDLYKEDVRDERNIQPLSDDYIKFIRFAHWKIEQAGNGVIGMITNNSYLSGLIHRGMRKKLLESFNEIYILNLHGNARIGEKTPEGGKDANVFDIMQGVSIALFIKNKTQKGSGKLFYHDVYGIRGKKYSYLDNNDTTSTKWKKAQPFDPYYLFVPTDFSVLDRYKEFFSVQNIFEKFSSGVNTMRDKFLVSSDIYSLKNRIRIFENKNLTKQELGISLGIKDTRDWKINEARKDFTLNEKFIIPYDYRPFDTRYLYYDEKLIDKGCSRKSLMVNFLDKKNIGLATSKSIQTKKRFNSVFISNKVNDGHFASDRSYIFPLYFYTESIKKELFNKTKDLVEKEPNIKPEFFSIISGIYGKEPTPEEIFYYIYGILYSNIYRERYVEFLRIDFPRVPFTKDYKLFIKMGEYGKKLVDLHLLKSKELDSPIARFQGEGDVKVEKYEYNKKEQRVYINETQYFEGVPEEVWFYQIGGYQVCRKWLRDRKGRGLSLDDIKHYCKIVTSIQKTIQIQKEIDKIYPKVEKKIVGFGRR